jgi:uncharacterized membrane protein
MKNAVWVLAALLATSFVTGITVPLTLAVEPGPFSIVSASVNMPRVTLAAGQGADVTVTTQLSSPGTVVMTALNTVADSNSTTVFTASFHVPFTFPSGNYTVTLTASNGTDTVTAALPLEILPLTAVGLDAPSLLRHLTPGSTLALEGDADFSSPSKPTLQNLGNVPIDLTISADTPTTGSQKVALSNILLSVDNATFITLKTSTQTLSVNLLPNQTIPLYLRITVPDTTSPGNYTGALHVSAKRAG